MPTPARYDVFVSAVSPELGSYRNRLAAALRSKGLSVCVQENFRQGPDTLLDQLAAYIRQCDAVLLLVGEHSGALPTAAHAALLGDTARVPADDYRALTGEDRLSYTQWEGLLARHYNRPTYTYLTRAGFVPDQPAPADEADRRRQQHYRDWLHHWGKYTEAFATWAELLEALWKQDFPTIPFGKPHNLPESLGEFFQGREEVLGALRRQFMAGAGGVQTAAIVGKALHGLGGVGKTRLAVEYGWRHQADYVALLLVGGDTPADLDRNLAALCARLALPEQHLPEEARQREAVLHWLRTTPGWLLVLDNLDTPEARQAAEALLKTPLAQARGHVLLTSRQGHWRPTRHPLALDVLTEDAAARLLLTLTDGRRRPTATDEAAALAVARALGSLPLALEQAGAYVAIHCLTLTDYLHKWQASDAALLAWYDPDVMDYPRSVAATWQTSFDQLGRESPDAQLLLNRLAWLAPDPIPESLLAVAIPNAPPYAEESANVLAHLARYSLVRRDKDSATPAFTVHRLVQAVTRRRLADAGEDKERLVETLEWVNASLVGDPQDVRSWPMLDPLLPHALAVTAAEYTEPLGDPEPTSRLLNDAGLLLYAKAQFNKAEPLMKRALLVKEGSPELRHYELATCLNNMATLFLVTNRSLEAEPLMRRALALMEKGFGEYHHHTARQLSNLANLLQNTDRLAEAEPLIRRALAIDETTFGLHHVNVAIRLNNLAVLLQDTDRLHEAELLIRRALTIDESSLGGSHPEVATDLNNLASILVATGRSSEAEQLLRRALNIDEVNSNLFHPMVAMRLNNLAGLLYATNRLPEAKQLVKRALLIYVRTLGQEHPSTEEVVANYSTILLALGQTEAQAAATIAALLATPPPQ